MNYGELKTELRDIAKVTATSSVGARVPRFVARAESMIRQKVRAIEMQQSVALLEADRVSPGSGQYNMPAGCIDVVEAVSVDGHLDRRTQAEISLLSTVLPVHSYCVRANLGVIRVQFRGTPGLNANLSTIFWGMPAALVADGDTNALLAVHEALYIHGSLHWLYLDAHDSELAATHLNAFKEESERINALANRAVRTPGINNLNFGISGSAM